MEFNIPKLDSYQTVFSLAELWSLKSVNPLLPLHEGEVYHSCTMAYQGRNINRKIRLKGTEDYILEVYSYEPKMDWCYLVRVQYFTMFEREQTGSKTHRISRIGAPAHLEVSELGTLKYAYCLGGLFHNVSGPAIRHYSKDGTIELEQFYLLNVKKIGKGTVGAAFDPVCEAEDLVRCYIAAGMDLYDVSHSMYNPYRVQPAFEFDFQMRFGMTYKEFWDSCLNFSDSSTAPYGTRALGLHIDIGKKKEWEPL